MFLKNFLIALMESGEVAVSSCQEIESGDDLAAALRQFDRDQRLNLAFEAPPFSLRAAGWAASRLYRACQLLILRDQGPAVIKKELSAPCPMPRAPETDYSVDLLFQYLPDLVALAKNTAAADPLVGALRDLGAEWPLSSVGMEDLGPVKIDSFVENPALLQLYVDRIIDRRDGSRLGMPRVDEAVREALRAFPELCPPLAERLLCAQNPERG